MRLSTGHERWVYGVGGLLAVSGALWLLFDQFAAAPGDFGPAPHPLQRRWLQLHGFSAAGFLILFGTLLPLHARLAWTARRNRVSGALLFAVVVWLIASGYGLYYVGHETVRNILSLGHWSLGLAAPALAVWHAHRGRRSRAPATGSTGDQDRA